MLFAKIDTLQDEDPFGFGGGDHLFLWAWRRIAYGQGSCPLLAAEFADAFGEEGADVLATLHVFLDALGIGSRYRLALGMPGGFALTRDEESVIGLLGATQSAQRFAFERRLDLLVTPEFRHVVSIAANALGKAFALNGLQLNLLAARAAMVCPQALAS